MRDVLVLEARRESYGISNIDTMTVRDLREFLDGYDDDIPVCVSHDNGYTYGAILPSRFRDMEMENDEDEEE